MAYRDPRIEDHLQWLGFVRPTGLVVSAPALVRANAVVETGDRDGQSRLRGCVSEDETGTSRIDDFSRFAREVLDWSFSPRGYSGGEAPAIPESLKVDLPDLGVTLQPDFAVRELGPVDSESDWQLLVRVLDDGRSLDAVPPGDELEATEHGRMERLLRDTGVPAGLLTNGSVLRLISAPRGESSGWLDFTVAEMTQTAGRPICAAMRMLLSERRLLALPREQRLTALLRHSREFQNEVSERLSGQVLGALYGLLRGFQAAHDASRQTLLALPLADEPDEIYRGLLTVVLRLVFLLYAEERDMLPRESTFLRGYSIAALHARLREDAGRYPDTMDQRYGAWSQLLALFRMVYDGARTGATVMPPRHGVLFDPDRYPFLEGRMGSAARQRGERLEAPRVGDGTVLEVLERLLVLDGERLSYRALDVEQIGSVYETMMGFRLRTTTGRSVAIRPGKSGGAPTVVSLDELSTVTGSKRAKWVLDAADRKLSPKVAAAVASADGVTELHAALGGVVDRAATPDLLAPEAMALQPSAERRRSGSHYTPRALTEPIVRTALRPVLDRLRDGYLAARPQAILELRVCDPAMGSAAFLVEACRQLGDELVASWEVHGGRPEVPPDEDLVTYARRLVAQRCLYGVDRNPVAVDLAKMSLWLITLASEHPLTFLDHALRHGDSLVGLDRRQIETFDWTAGAPSLASIRIGRHLERVAELRSEIREAPDDTSDATLRDLWDEAEHELGEVRLYGDLLAEAFFSGATSKERETARVAYADEIAAGTAAARRAWLEELRHAERPLAPFHWQVELPEVFDRENPGFDVIVGNPPFSGAVPLARANQPGYTDWLRKFAPGAHGKADLVGFFLRRAYALVRRGTGTLGLIATNTLTQGDTRESSLLPILSSGGWIYRADRRLRWPGAAAVIVSVIHVQREPVVPVAPVLNNRNSQRINAYLLATGPDGSPDRLMPSVGCFLGVKPGSRVFVVSSHPSDGFSDVEMQGILHEEPSSEAAIKPYLSGEDILDSSSPKPARRVIDLSGVSASEAERRLPVLTSRLRDRLGKSSDEDVTYTFSRPAKQLMNYLRTCPGDQVICTVETAKWHVFVMLTGSFVPSNKVVVITSRNWSILALLQSSTHEVWRRQFGSTLGDGLVYVPADCFETFPFAPSSSLELLEDLGRTYQQERSDVLVGFDAGLTTLYNRFHDPDENDPSILRFRDLHTEMDRAVLHAYGWDDVPTDCEFLLDYDIDEAEWGSKRKPYRYRWPDEVRDDVLARLIALNRERAAEEQRNGAATASKEPRRRNPKQNEALL